MIDLSEKELEYIRDCIETAWGFGVQCEDDTLKKLGFPPECIVFQKEAAPEKIENAEKHIAKALGLR